MRDWKAHVGGNIRRYRKEAALTQEQLAEKAQIDFTYVSGIETGKRNPSLMVMVRISEALGVELAQLVE
ncbi:MAG: helix-turn-helix transcriptional regulator [Parasphingorhabdus sp.]